MSGGICYEKLSCECGSSDGKQVFKEGELFTAYCFVCGKYDPDPYRGGTIRVGPPPNKRSDEDIRADILKASGLPIEAIEDRGLTKETCEYFNFHVAVSPVDGETIEYHYYPSSKGGNLTGWEVRKVNPKKFFALGDRKDLDLGNIDKALAEGGKYLYIAEDALSGASCFQAIKQKSAGTKWSHRNPSVAYLTNGAGSIARQLAKHAKDIQASFEGIVLALDQDDAGQKAVEVATKMMPEGFVRTVSLPLKDPNDMVMAGRSEELANALLFNHTRSRFDGVREVSDYFNQATKMPEWGLPWPWPSATEATYGIRTGEIHVVGAAPKIGKTDHHHTLVEWMINELGEVVGVFDLENTGGKTIRRLAGKTAKKPFHKPDGDFTQEELIEAVRKIDGKVKLYDSDGDRNWESIQAAIRAMASVDGVRFFFLDNLTSLISMMDASSANDALNKIMTEFASMAQKFDITFFLYTHLNPPSHGKPHEQGGKVLSSQFTGSRAMEKWAHYGWGIERNRLSPDPEERNTSQFVLLFDREFGNSTRFPVYYDHVKGTYLEPDQDSGEEEATF